MGQTYEFVCSECGHASEVSGGPDSGFVAATETTFCRRCGDLVDVIVEEKKQGAFQKRARISCPNCHGLAVEPWDRKKKPRPKCGAKMKRGDALVMWD